MSGDVRGMLVDMRKPRNFSKKIVQRSTAIQGSSQLAEIALALVKQR
jgi:hypothetical protein